MNQPAQQQDVPGVQSEMTPRPDCGEESYRGSGRLEGKSAVITGGDSGIGRAIAIAFAREGADVLISYLDEDEDAKDTARLVEEAGRKAVLVGGDLSKAQHCRELIAKAVSEFGKVDVLVSNAAYQMSHESLDEISEEEWDYTLDTNISALFHLAKAAVPHMPAGGSIIGSSSVNSDMPSPSLAPYAATKAAIANFTASLADARVQGHPRQQRGARTGVDPAHSGDHAPGKGRELRQGRSAGSAGSACRTCAGVRAAGLGRGQLHQRCPNRGHRRQPDPVEVRPRRTALSRRTTGRTTSLVVRRGALRLLSDLGSTTQPSP